MNERARERMGESQKCVCGGGGGRGVKKRSIGSCVDGPSGIPYETKDLLGFF